MFSQVPRSDFSGTFAVAADNLHFVRLNGLLIVEFEGHIFDQEGPDFVAKTVRIQVALQQLRRRRRRINEPFQRSLEGVDASKLNVAHHHHHHHREQMRTGV